VFLARYGAKAATYGQKVARIAGSVAALGERVECDRAVALTAATLCKADLATATVGEFPELQGVMGMHYARAAHGDAVARAIAEHYMPKGAGAELPSSAEGALVAIADRMDTLVGCFAASLEPTGSADPYGLRRAAIGVLAILLARSWELSLDNLMEIAAEQYTGTLEVTATDQGELMEFFRGRLRGLLIEEGLAALDVDAALGAGFEHVNDTRSRARALSKVPAAAREVFKRIANILDDAAAKGFSAPDLVDEQLFVSPAEGALYSAFSARLPLLVEARTKQDYATVIQLLVDIQPIVAAFFDKGGVMVMDPDPQLRDNRLGLLAAVLRPFSNVADFRALAVQS
jgi:glycyl-tRNA synthetase beta chain